MISLLQVQNKTSKLLETGLFRKYSPWAMDSNNFVLTLIYTRFTYYVWSGSWFEDRDGYGYTRRHIKCDTEYVIDNVDEDIQIALLFNLELFRSKT